jgi:hypothetical protein
LFGGLGWGFGGSISYMHTVSYTAANQWETAWYGFFAMFLVGGLWAGMGGLGTALPAVADRKRLTDLYVPLGFVLAMLILHKFIEAPIEQVLMTGGGETDDRWNRHKSPLYWMDTDWFSALMALFGVWLFDLWDRRFGKLGWLVVFAGCGALAGWGVQQGLDETGLTEKLTGALVVPLGDLTAINPDTGKPFDPDNLLTNWPQFFSDFPQHVGWGVGLLLGAVVYFYRFGAFRRGSSLFLYMCYGWLIAFLVMPVLGTIPLQAYGGFRLTPPRSDDWAGVLGVFVGTSVYMFRKGLAPVAYAGAVSGILGGILFATMQVVRAMLIVPGHPYRTPGGTPEAWQHYQSANWHSFMEQSHGFGHGVAIAVALGLLWSRVNPPAEDGPRRKWTDVFAIGFVVFFMTYLNLFKNPNEWADKLKGFPTDMKAPLIESIELSAQTWFNLAWLAASVVFIGLMIVHTRRRLDIVPATWLGRGQLVYVLMLWIMVIGNFERALPQFSQGRLLTEWVIFINAAIATFLLVFTPGPNAPAAVRVPTSFSPLYRRAWLKGLLAAAVILSAYAGLIRFVYGEATVFYPGYAHKRWGPQAAWRVTPIEKNKDHR